MNGDVQSSKKWGTVDGVTAYSFGFVACNLGTEPLHWAGQTPQHPVMASNLYRLKNGKFEQIGMSWVKHVYAASAETDCCTCVDPGTPYLLGVGCSDAYGASLNGNQDGSGTAGGLGPRSDVNPYTGELVWPYTTQGQEGNAIYKRLQVKNSDLAPASNPDALYFAEGHFISGDDSESGNQSNNASYKQVTVGAFEDGGWELEEGDSTHMGQPAIYAWQQFDPGVQITEIDVPDDGRLILASRCTENADGSWHYEYALHNLNSDRAVRAFSIPVPPGVQVENIGFHDIAYHSGEPYDGAAWESGIDSGKLRWKTQTFDDNPNANALRWGTLYNFRFNAEAPPTTVAATIQLFKPGTPDQISVDICGPSPGAIGEACDQAIELSLGTTDFSNADSSQDEPDVDCANSISHVKWFKYTSTFRGRLRISTCGTTDFDTVLAVYSNCSCETFNLIACSENASGCDGGSKLVIEVEPGDCCLIQLAGKGNQSGSGSLRLSCADSGNVARADAIFTGNDPSGRFGCALGSGGRFNGNASNGILIGAYTNDQNGTHAGVAEVRSGQGLDQTLQFTGFAEEELGMSVAGRGDCDGDGQDDWIIGAPGNSENGSKAGKVYVYSGATQALIWSQVGAAAGDRFGWAVACAGDVNEDGFDDVIVGAPWNDGNGEDAGRAYVYNGSTGELIYKLNGSEPGDRFGTAVCAIGDLNNDGAGDFAVGAPYHDDNGSNSGRVNVYSGHNKKVLQRIDGSSSGDHFGASLAGTTYGSGSSRRTILIVGAPYHDDKSGQARVYVRRHSNPECSAKLCHEFTFNGQHNGDRFGTSVAVGKLVGNSRRDFVVGAPYADLNGSSSGTFSIFDGSDGALEDRFYGEAPGDRLGWAVSVPGDVNGDGKDDLVVGAPYNDAGGGSAGRAYAFLSSNSSLAFMLANPEDVPVLTQVSNKGDVNEDGVADQADLLAVIESWGTCQGECAADVEPAGGDQVVNADDLLSVLSAWLDEQ